jgi:hypothetical protein
VPRGTLLVEIPVEVSSHGLVSNSTNGKKEVRYTELERRKEQKRQWISQRFKIMASSKISARRGRVKINKCILIRGICSMHEVCKYSATNIRKQRQAICQKQEIRRQLTGEISEWQGASKLCGLTKCIPSLRRIKRNLR